MSNQRGSTKQIEKYPVNMLKLKPITPQSLSLYSTNSLNVTAPVYFSVTHHLESTQAIEKKRNFTSQIKERKNKTQVPEFVKEYLQESIPSHKPILHQNYIPLEEKSKPRIMTSKPIKQRRFSHVSRKRSKTLSKDFPKIEEIDNNDKLYQPQILYVSPRSKIRIFSTVNIGQQVNKSSTHKKKEFSILSQHFAKPHVSSFKIEDEAHKATEEPIEYLKPAMTFGEKLWRLNEVSIFSMIPK